MDLLWPIVVVPITTIDYLKILKHQTQKKKRNANVNKNIKFINKNNNKKKKWKEMPKRKNCCWEAEYKISHLIILKRKEKNLYKKR